MTQLESRREFAREVCCDTSTNLARCGGGTVRIATEIVGLWVYGRGQTRPWSECRAPLIALFRKSPRSLLVRTGIVQADKKQVAARYRCV